MNEHTKEDTFAIPLAPTTPPPNPKKLYGDKKPDLGQLPLAGMIHQALAHMDGAHKYGNRNWRVDPVEARTYIGAILRHIQLYAEGEDLARDTSVHNLGGIMACCAILLDAEVNKTLVDNRVKSPGACDLLHEYGEDMVSILRQAQIMREFQKKDSQ